MSGLGAYPLVSSWAVVTPMFARQLLNFGDVTDVEGVTQSQWFFGATSPTAYTLEAVGGLYVLTGASATVGVIIPTIVVSESTTTASTVANTLNGDVLISETAAGADASSNAKVVNVSMSDSVVVSGTPARTWNPINSPQATTWVVIESGIPGGVWTLVDNNQSTVWSAVDTP